MFKKQTFAFWVAQNSQACNLGPNGESLTARHNAIFILAHPFTRRTRVAYLSALALPPELGRAAEIERRRVPGEPRLALGEGEARRQSSLLLEFSERDLQPKGGASRSALQPGTWHSEPGPVRSTTPTSMSSLIPGGCQTFIPEAWPLPTHHPQPESSSPTPLPRSRVPTSRPGHPLG